MPLASANSAAAIRALGGVPRVRSRRFSQFAVAAAPHAGLLARRAAQRTGISKICSFFAVQVMT
jgi:hypothetical protein